MMRLTKARLFVADLFNVPGDATVCEGPDWEGVLRFTVCAVRGHWFRNQFCGRCGAFWP